MNEKVFFNIKPGQDHQLAQAVDYLTRVFKNMGDERRNTSGSITVCLDIVDNDRALKRQMQILDTLKGAPGMPIQPMMAGPMSPAEARLMRLRRFTQ
jgi:hypothetical protein